MRDSCIEQVRPSVELYIGQSHSLDTPYIALNNILVGGDLKCFTPDGRFQLFDPNTDFVSYCTTVIIGAVFSIALAPAILYRIFDLNRHEKGTPTLNGQISKVFAVLVPTLQLTSFYLNRVDVNVLEWILVGVAYLAAALHHIQDGRVTVCCGELLIYWLGMIGVNASVSLDALLSTSEGGGSGSGSGGSSANWLLHVASLLTIAIFVLELTNKARTPVRESAKHFDDETIFAKISVAFADPLIAKGAKENITKDDYPVPPAGLNAVNGYTKFENELSGLAPNARLRVLRASVSQISGKLVVLTIMDALSEAISFIQPTILGLFLNSLTNYTSGNGRLFTSYYFGVLLGVAPVISTSFSNLVRLLMVDAYVSIRVSLLSAIYRKALRLNPSAREKFESSKIMNLISVDSAQIYSIAQILPTLVSAPLDLVFSVVQLWYLLGPSMFSAVGIYLVIIPITSVISSSFGKLVPAQMAALDKRTKLTSNIFRNIKSLKLYAWEDPFYERVKDNRENQELKVLRKISIMGSVLSLIWNMMSDLVASAVFVTFLWLKEGALTPDIIFPAMLLLQYATIPFVQIPMATISVVRCLTSQRRINELLNEPEQDYANYYRVKDGAAQGYEEPAVIVDNATVSWNGEDAENKLALKEVSFSATRGDLVCITGRVGSGKTALLKALGGELSIVGGSITVKGSIAYCTQEVWLQNQTLRNNILFGQTYQEEWYNQVIEACELKADIRQMPKGDETDVGERGITLSGGQKARVALARAVYSRADVFLLDDVLSAVDEHVSAKLTEKLLSSRGLLANRTIILATNNVKVLSNSSLIVALADKTVGAADSFAQVVKRGADSSIFRIIEEFGHADDLKQEAEHIEDRKAAVIELESKDSSYHPESLSSRPISINAENFRLVSDDDEEKETSAVSLSIYKRYFAILPHWITVFFLVTLVLSTFVTNFTSIYLGYLSNQALETLYQARWYIGTYLGIVLLSSLLIFLSNVWCNVIIGMGTSRILHNTMLRNLMHAPMSFFDATPLGRLINRFTDDIAKLDSSLPTTIYYTLRSALNLLVNIIAILSGGPIVFVVIAPLIFVGNQYRRMYVPASRKISRMGSAANSPILSHIEESLKGQALLRTFDRVPQFIEIYEKRVDYWIRISFTQTNTTQWLGFRIQLMSCVLMLACAASVTHLVGSGSISVGYSAVVVHFASRAGIMVRQTLDFLAQIEVSGVSLARILEYVDAKQEAPAHIEATTPPKSWPAEGRVEFKELSARYTEDGKDVLKNLSFAINSGEKIGIVGRTGSGKSTLTMTLFRILEAYQGHIEIDGRNINDLGLFDLRSKLAIIPQDAQIFDGTVRENLDPLNTCEDDARLWEILELCHLKTHFESQELGLDTVLTDSGDNLSRGQSQLLCLGRALIHKAKLLVLDEATASVDVETDKIVQETIRKNFSDRTIITIAHRLNTIMDSDRIIVLDYGEIKEFDTPANLLAQKGLFHGLYTNAKKEEENEL